VGRPASAVRLSSVGRRASAVRPRLGVAFVAVVLGDFELGPSLTRPHVGGSTEELIERGRSGGVVTFTRRGGGFGSRHYKKLRRTAVKAEARTTLPCESREVGTWTGWAVGTFMRDKTADTGVPGPR